MKISEQTTEKLIRIRKLIDEELKIRKAEIEKTICKFRGADNAYGFKKDCDISEIVKVSQNIWDNPEKYSDYSGEAAYYDFLKYLYVVYPDGTEVNLTDIIDTRHDKNKL